MFTYGSTTKAILPTLIKTYKRLVIFLNYTKYIVKTISDT